MLNSYVPEKLRSMCANGVLLDVIKGAEGTRWDSLGWHGTTGRERMRRWEGRD